MGTWRDNNKPIRAGSKKKIQTILKMPIFIPAVNSAEEVSSLLPPFICRRSFKRVKKKEGIWI